MAASQNTDKRSAAWRPLLPRARTVASGRIKTQAAILQPATQKYQKSHLKKLKSKT